MATAIMLRNPNTGLTATGYYGFSWTTLLFGFFPALFRGDLVTFLVVAAITIVLALSTVVGGLVFSFAWAFFYNRYYTRNLISKGYKIMAPTANEQLAAMTSLGVTI
jgi:hypothetical protein